MSRALIITVDQFQPAHSRPHPFALAAKVAKAEYFRLLSNHRLDEAAIAETRGNDEMASEFFRQAMTYAAKAEQCLRPAQ